MDGTFVPELPSLLFLHNRFDRSVNVMVGHNGDEGVGYPGLTSDAAFDGKSRKQKSSLNVLRF